MGKRGSDDKEWQELKVAIKKRDIYCRLVRIMGAREFLILQHNAQQRLSILDPAHVFGVGPHPEMCYLKKNVVLLNRYSHDALDSCKHPITGDPISREERDNWWKKIVGEETYAELEKISREKNNE